MKNQDRIYKIQDGDSILHCPSVTTILKVKHSEALFRWALNKGKKKAEEISTEAADIGTDVHSLIEKYLRNPDPIPATTDTTERPFTAFLGWAKETNLKPIELETVVYSPTYHYAGRCDFIGLINGVTSIADWKSSKGVYNTMFCQMAAYYYAIWEMSEAGIRVDWNEGEGCYKVSRHDWKDTVPSAAWVVRLDKLTGEPEPVEIPLNKLDECFKIFEAMKNLYDWDKKTDCRIAEYLAESE